MAINYPYKGKIGAATLWFVFVPAMMFTLIAYPWMADLRVALIGNVEPPGRYLSMVVIMITAAAIILGRGLRFWIVAASVGVVAAAFLYS